MILGLDVGGTQTDAVLVEGREVVRAVKTPTGGDLLETLRASLDETLPGISPERIERTAFSTTMATNAVVQDRLDRAGMIVSAGPGMNPEWFAVGPAFHVVKGCLDHQGIEAVPLDRKQVMDVADGIRKQGIRHLGVAGKFSVHNPGHELQVKEWVGRSFSHVALGHRVSGILNFPRRIATTYLNAALHDLHHGFAAALLQILKEKNLLAPRFLLKPDGGTVDLERAGASPAGTAQSGPAASVMGALALDGCRGTTLVLDVGGTTTDMAVVLDGIPVRAPYGVRLGPYRTLIRSLLTRSIGLGGDSEVRWGKHGSLRIGPVRRGMPAALGGPSPTPTDAMIVLGLLDAGDREKAVSAMERLAPAEQDPVATAEQVLSEMARSIADAARSFIDHLNSRPVYTIHEVLREERVTPVSVVVIGGPAPYVAARIGEALGLPHRVPPHFGVANAVGAAVARVTSEVTLQADTRRGSVVIPEARLHREIDSAFGMDDAMALARGALRDEAAAFGADPADLDITVAEQQVFNMIRGYSRTGKNIRLKLCVTPGLIPEWK